MLLDTRNQSADNTEGFNPNVQNAIRTPKRTAWMWVMIIFLTNITIGIFWFSCISMRNWLNRKQEQINTSASNISVQLVQRKDTLVKLLDVTKSYMKYEKETLTGITELRSLKTSDIKPENISQLNSKLDKVASGINVTLENYPNLKANQAAMELMAAADANEREISAARRIYNQDVNEFNQKIFTFPSQFVAAGMSLHTLPLFEASAEQKKDVNLSINF